MQVECHPARRETESAAGLLQGPYESDQDQLVCKPFIAFPRLCKQTADRRR